MAKKKRLVKRSTKARKPQPAADPRSPPVVENFDPTPYQIAARQRAFPAAVQSTIGGVDPPLPLRAGAHMIEPRSTDLFLRSRDDKGIVTPTIYPDSPQGPIIVQNQHITINIQSAEFSRFDKNLEALIGELHRSNEISGEVRDQLVSELWAGRKIIAAPKPQRGLIDLLLVTPLKWLAEKSGSAIVSKLAGDALEWLIKMLQ